MSKPSTQGPGDEVLHQVLEGKANREAANPTHGQYGA